MRSATIPSAIPDSHEVTEAAPEASIGRVDADWNRLSDDELLRRARREADAFAAFYSRHERLTLAFFIGRVGDAEVGADLAAETFAAAPKAVPRFRRRREPATAWLLGIARNVLA